LLVLIAPLFFAALPASGGSISGKVTGPDGTTPLQDITVEIRQQSSQAWPVVKTNHTDAAGLYTVDGLADGGYIVAFYDPAGTYARKLYEDALLVYNARTVTVASASSASNINVKLELSGKIIGTVTYSDGSPVGEYDLPPRNWTVFDESPSL